MREIITKDAELAQQAGGDRNPWPANEPNWEYNNADDRAACETGIQKLVEAIRACGE